MANKPTYNDLEQRIAFLEQELHDKNEKLSLLTSNFENELKLPQEKARESEHNIKDIAFNFETFFNTIDDFLFVLDEQGIIVHCNNTVEKRLGYTLEELKGKSILSVHLEERRSEAAKVAADVIAGKLASFQIPLVTKQGKHILVETYANYGVWNGKPAIFGVSKDITKLKLSEEKFSTVFYLNPSASGLSEAKTGRYIEVNDAFCKLFGFTKEETIGHNVVELQIMSKKTRDEILSKADSLGRIYNAEAELKTKNGDVKRVLLSGQNIYIQDNIYRYTIVHDVTEIHKTKQIAEENERKFTIAFHSSPSVSMITNIDTGEILEANEAVEQFAGYSRAEMVGKSVFNLNLWAADADRNRFIELLTRDKKVLNFESTFRKKSGEAFIGLISGQMIQIQNQNCLLSIIHDITDLKRIENELIKAKEIAEENEQKFSMLFNSCPEPLSVTTFEDGCFIMTNEAFHNDSGFDREDVINHRSLELNGLLNIEDRQKWVDELVKNGSVRSIEVQLLTKKYGIRDYLISSDIIMLDKKKCAINFYIDITDRKNAELELLKAKEKVEESEEKFRNLYESLSITYMILKDGVCIECNKASLAIHGVKSKDELIGKSPAEFSPEFQPNHVKSSEAAAKNMQIAMEKGYHTFEWVSMRKNKEEFFAEVSLKKFYYKNELYIQCLTTDITERKKIENELIAAKNKAEESDRLKTAFLQNISHEIRTPLNAICGFSGFLSDENLSVDKRKRFGHIIQNSSSQLLSVVSNILMISSLETKQEKINISKVSLNSVIIELLEIFKHQARNRNISVYAKQQLTDKQSEINTDRNKITQILSNLLSNALKFTHAGSIEFGYQLINNEIEFYVKDTGVGIKPESYEKIFERFCQADKTIQTNYGGTGLGLSICKGFVELLGGKIWVQSEIEKGSTFYFTIPYKPANKINKIASPGRQNKNLRTILVAEDDEYNFIFIEEVLSHLPLKLIHAKDGKEAIEIFKSDPQIDLILMDIKMPVMNGYDAAKIIKSIRPDIPIIAQSAYAMDYERVRYEEVFDDYLTKPLKEEILVDVISKITRC